MEQSKFRSCSSKNTRGNTPELQSHWNPDNSTSWAQAPCGVNFVHSRMITFLLKTLPFHPKIKPACGSLRMLAASLRNCSYWSAVGAPFREQEKDNSASKAKKIERFSNKIDRKKWSRKWSL